MSKRKAKQAANTVQKNNLVLRDINPLTDNQRVMFQEYDSGYNLFVHGYAGTGKSFLSLFLALDEIEETGDYDGVILIRSVVPSRDMGFLPGSIKEKSRVYETPYVQIVNDLYNRGDAYTLLKDRGIIDFETTSFLRGCTWSNKIIIVDEAQNMTFQELDTTMTRVGPGSKIIFCGDFRQTDLVHDRDKSGLQRFINITKEMHKFRYIEFMREDIVRSGLVKDYIIAKTELEAFV